MHEKFEEEMERQERRLDDSIFQSPTVSCLADIKRVISELDPARATKGSIPIISEMVADNEDGHKVTYKVSAITDFQDKRGIVIKGFEFIRDRMDFEERSNRDAEPVTINGRAMRPSVKSAAAARAWIDPLLERWFSAAREGLKIVWKIKDGKIVYDPFTHKLYKAKVDE